MTAIQPFPFCHLRDTSNKPVELVDMGEWLRKPVSAERISSIRNHEEPKVFDIRNRLGC